MNKELYEFVIKAEGEVIDYTSTEDYLEPQEVLEQEFPEYELEPLYQTEILSRL